MSQQQQGISCGLDYTCVANLQSCLRDSIDNEYSFILFPLVHPRFRRPHTLGKTIVDGFTRSDMILLPSEWTARVVGKLSPYLDVDAPSLVARQRHEDCMNEELAYCRGLGLPAIMLNLRGKQSINLARIVSSYFANSHHPSLFWVRVPMVSEKLPGESENSDDNDAAWNETWEWWSQFHEHLEFDKRVGVVLELSADLPPSHLLQRWLGEPVKAVILPTSIFVHNRKGYPVLTRAHQQLIQQMVLHDAQLIVSGVHHFNVEYYVRFLNRMWAQRPKSKHDPMLDFAMGWEDYIQTPLQPLADNLDTHTYNVFERDPIKYNQYQKAIEQALLDFQKGEPSYHETKEENHLKSDENSSEKSQVNSLTDQKSQGDSEDVRKCFTIMVLGAGRGPLVRAAFNAADITNSRVKLIVVEKNPCAAVTLIALAREIWSNRDVQVISGDMREIQLETQADIIVSELLGSWGDNELSPECLDGAAALLRPDGISIPCSYTSYVAPISSPRLWAAARGISTSPTSAPNPNKNLETLWVVYMQNKFDIAEVKPVFTFDHPSKGAQDSEGQEVKDAHGLPTPDTRRSAILEWEANEDSVMHGFGGYFHCTLYGEHTISIVPTTHTSGMISWFPVFIPIKTPLRVKKGDKITAWFWRCRSSRRVWYEWIVQAGEHTTLLHNCNGCSSEMLL